MKMIAIKSKQFKSIGYNEEEKAIYVEEMENIIRVFQNKTKEDFQQFVNSKQHDFFYLFVLRSFQHKIIQVHM
jgi:hypothetical protein